MNLYGGGGLVPKSCLTLATPWTIAHQAPLSMRFSRQEYWSGLPFASPGDLPNPGIKPRFPTLPADSLLPEPPTEAPGVVKCVFDSESVASLETSVATYLMILSK